MSGITQNNNTDTLDNALIVIKGGTDNTSIGNVGDSLKVTSSESPTPVTNVMWYRNECLNGSSNNQNVSGTLATPVNFDYTPTSGVTEYLHSIIFGISDVGSNNFDTYGAIAALTNGVQVIIISNGVTYTYATLKTNLHVLTTFPENKIITPGTGFLESGDHYSASITFPLPIILKNSTSDKVRFSVRDTLTGLVFQTAAVRTYRVL